jgi:SsrA-binding protein
VHPGGGAQAARYTAAPSGSDGPGDGVASKSAKGRDRDLATNRSASHRYALLERFEAGIALTGAEVKSIREGRIQLKEAYARIRGGEVFLVGAHVSPYRNAAHEDPDPVRDRKLLLHAREIRRLIKETAETGVTIVPTRAYLRNGRVKIEIAIGRGKRAADKRDSIKEREARREIDRATHARRAR